MTVEGENDDITGLGQCRAAHRLCHNLPAAMKTHHLQPKVGHYGIFNGSRFREDIVPAIGAFTRQHDLRGSGPLKRALKQMRGTRPVAIAPESVSHPPRPAIIVPGQHRNPAAATQQVRRTA
jgi:poly(3-hydroxybutyrate) depolymerase